jgi:ubiquinone/menaquinone biosynthesis C-methylase UbiE
MKILDACCGGRMMWFDKENKDTTYMDIESRPKGCIKQQKNFSVNPDIIGDFRDMPFKDNTFDMVVFDPPHSFVSKDSIIGKKYGTLNKESWKDDINKGFNECMRVLKNDGILILKWSEPTIKVSELLKLLNKKPLFGHTTGKSGNTKWMTFKKGD